MYQSCLRPLLFRIDPETAHHLGLGTLRFLGAVPGMRSLLHSICHRGNESLAVQALGLTFPNPIGIAAGFDKNAEVHEALSALGFGFVEVGTLTAHGQPGNDQPRLFRLPADRALINRLGFNNRGSANAQSRLAKPRRSIVGVNIGKSRKTDLQDAVDDYRVSTDLLAPHADYLVVNVSSPNTPGLRTLQAVDQLRPLLLAVREAADESCGRAENPRRKRCPLLVKVSPDLDDRSLQEIAELAMNLGLDGIIATNTTLSRDKLHPDPTLSQSGGLSGQPLRGRATEVLHQLRRLCGDELTLISVGGIAHAADVRERLDAGATLVQLYTSFVYAGPMQARRITKGLRRMEPHPLKQSQHEHIAQRRHA